VLGSSVLVHATTLAGETLAQPISLVLHIGTGVVAAMGCVLAERPKLPPPWTRWELWRAAVANTPSWTRNTLYALLVYGFVQFALLVGSREHNTGGGFFESVEMLRLFSSNWILLSFGAYMMAHKAAQAR
jgi:hypothetical protein